MRRLIRKTTPAEPARPPSADHRGQRDPLAALIDRAAAAADTPHVRAWLLRMARADGTDGGRGEGPHPAPCCRGRHGVRPSPGTPTPRRATTDEM
jgi:hypothetical protein